MRHRIHAGRPAMAHDRYHREGWNAALESLEDAVLNELGEVLSREDVLRQIRLLMDNGPPNEPEPF